MSNAATLIPDRFDPEPEVRDRRGRTLKDHDRQVQRRKTHRAGNSSDRAHHGVAPMMRRGDTARRHHRRLSHTAAVDQRDLRNEVTTDIDRESQILIRIIGDDDLERGVVYVFRGLLANTFVPHQRVASLFS